MRSVLPAIAAAGALLRAVTIVGLRRARPRLARGVLAKFRRALATGPAVVYGAEDAALVRRTEAFVREEMAGQDGSHDWFHIERVRNLALKLARMEKLASADTLTVELAALLHDIKDWKYSGSESAGSEAVREFLESERCAPSVVEGVVDVVERIGYKSELGAGAEPKLTPVLAVVQDADRLDAIGAIGIARTFTYGGARNRALYDPAKKPHELGTTYEAYTKKGKNEPTVNHFYEKLLLLKDKMKTDSGRQLAKGRHEYMESYLERFYAEWDGEA